MKLWGVWVMVGTRAGCESLDRIHRRLMKTSESADNDRRADTVNAQSKSNKYSSILSSWYHQASVAKSGWFKPPENRGIRRLSVGIVIVDKSGLSAVRGNGPRSDSLTLPVASCDHDQDHDTEGPAEDAWIDITFFGFSCRHLGDTSRHCVLRGK